MLELTVNLDERSYPIFIGQSALQDNGRLVHHIGDCRPIIITNDTVSFPMVSNTSRLNGLRKYLLFYCKIIAAETHA